MAKVAGTGVIRLATTAAGFSVVQDTHARVKQATNARLVSVICSCICNLYDGSALDLIGAENPELNSYNGLNVRSGSVQSARHLSYLSGNFYRPQFLRQAFRPF